MKIFLSLIVAIVSGLILGYIPSKILSLDFQPFGFLFTFGAGVAGSKIGLRISDWTRINIVGIACALIIGLTAFYNYQLHLYLPIKRNPPRGTPPAIVDLKNSSEPQGFFRYAQLTAFDEVQVIGRRGRKNYMPKMGVWIVEVVILGVIAFAVPKDDLEN